MYVVEGKGGKVGEDREGLRKHKLKGWQGWAGLAEVEAAMLTFQPSIFLNNR